MRYLTLILVILLTTAEAKKKTVYKIDIECKETLERALCNREKSYRVKTEDSQKKYSIRASVDFDAFDVCKDVVENFSLKEQAKTFLIRFKKVKLNCRKLTPKMMKRHKD